MTISPRAARALRIARLRQRDVAAADHAVAAANRDDADDAVASSHANLERALDRAGETLAVATSVYDLDRINDVIADEQRAVASAYDLRDAAAAAAERAASLLQARTRQLRTAERLCDLVDRECSNIAARAEQRAHDDRASRRKA
jgi:hypothetical protein